MNFTQRTRGIVKAIAVVLSLALPVMLAISAADARIGGGVSSGSRGARTFSAPPSTSTAPGAAQPFNRTMTQPGSPGVGAPAAAGGGFFNRPGMGMLGGLAAGFLGAGLLGMLFGGGMFGGLGGLSSIFGLILQIGLIIIVVRLAMSWWQRRHTAASAYAGAAPGATVGPGTQSSFRTGTGFGLGTGSAPLEIVPADYEAFTCLKDGTRTADAQVERDAKGALRYHWRKNTPALAPKDEQRLVAAGKIKPHETRWLLRDRDTGKTVLAHAGSVLQASGLERCKHH